MKEKTRISLGYAKDCPGLSQLIHYLDSFNASHGKLEVIPQMISETEEEFPEKLFVSRKDAVLPDIVIFHAETLPLLARKELILPLDESMKSYLISFWDLLETIQAMVAYKNQVWALPLLQADPFALFYNRSLFSEHKLSASPRTWEEFAEACRALTADTNSDGIVDTWGFLYDPVLFAILLLQNGGRVFDVSGEMVSFHQTEGMESLRMLHALMSRYAAPHFDFSREDIGMCIASPDKFLEIKDVKCHVSSLPWTRARGNLAGGIRGPLCFAVVRKKRKKPAASLEFLKWWDDTENYVQWCMFSHHVPLKKSAAGNAQYEEYLKNYPVMKIFLEELTYSVPIFPCEASVAVRKILESLVHSFALREEKEDSVLREALDRAATQAQDALDSAGKS